MLCRYASAANELDETERAELDGMSGTAAARFLNVGATVAKEHKRGDCVCGKEEPVKADTSAGESETHRPDGSADYTRFSETPWGYDDYREFIRSTGQDPDKVTFTWGWTSNPAGGVWNKLNGVRPIAGAVE